jgi:hypothetical protein
MRIVIGLLFALIILDFIGTGMLIDERRQRVGDMVVVQKDTLAIVDYSYWSGYTLSNGLRMDVNGLENFTIIRKTNKTK